MEREGAREESAEVISTNRKSYVAYPMVSLNDLLLFEIFLIPYLVKQSQKQRRNKKELLQLKSSRPLEQPTTGNYCGRLLSTFSNQDSTSSGGKQQILDNKLPLLSHHHQVQVQKLTNIPHCNSRASCCVCAFVVGL